jgi:hypothetical protein
LVPPVAVSPLKPGSVSEILRIANFGGATVRGDPFQSVTSHSYSPLIH